MSKLRFAGIILATTLLVACNLRDTIERPDFNDSGSSTTDASEGDLGGDAGTDATSTPDVDLDVDGARPDVAVDMGEPDLPDVPLTAENFYQKFLESLCAAYLRIDLQPNDFYWWNDVPTCVETLSQFAGLIGEHLADDIAAGRVTVDLAAAQSLLDEIDAATGPTPFEDFSPGDALVPTAAEGEACATRFACVGDPASGISCLKTDPTSCLGVCGRSEQRCEGTICGPNEICRRPAGAPAFCQELRVDGEACTDDTDCENFCIFDATGGGTCGSLALGADCSLNFFRCGDGRHCAADTDTCADNGDVGDPCANDLECVESAYCASDGTCEAMGERTPCRNGACPGDLACLRDSIAETSTSCYGQRQNNEPCLSDAHCPASSYCDGSQNPPRCVARRQMGQSCRRNNACSAGLVCRFDSPDAQNGECQRREWGLADREVCYANVATCSFGLYCDKDSATSYRGICEARERPMLQDSCEVTLECVGSYCAGARCAAHRTAGQSCNGNEMCDSFVCAPGSQMCVDRAAVCAGEDDG